MSTESRSSIFSEKILTTIKLNLGLGEDYIVFDREVMNAINMALFDLDQLFDRTLVKDFALETGEETWGQYVSEETFKMFSTIPTYITQKVRLVFDPPSNNFTIEAIERQLARMEFRLTVRDDEDTLGGKTNGIL